MEFLTGSSMDALQFLLVIFGSVLVALSAIHIINYQRNRRRGFMTEMPAITPRRGSAVSKAPAPKKVQPASGPVTAANNNDTSRQPGRHPRKTANKDPRRARRVKAQRPSATNARKYVIRLGNAPDAATGQQRLARLSAQYPAVLKRFKPGMRSSRRSSRHTGFDLYIGPIANAALASEACKALKGVGLKECRLQSAGQIANPPRP